MPLIEGCSRETVSENIEKLLDEGYSEDQAEAIAIDTAIENRKKCGPERQRELEEMMEE